MTDRASVFITGMGAVTPYGLGVDLFWDKLVAGTDAIRQLTRFPMDNYRVKVGGQFPGNLDDLVDCPSGDLATRFVLTASQEALRSAGLQVPPGRCAVVLGTNFAQVEQAEKILLARRRGNQPPPEVLDAFHTESAALEILDRHHLSGTVSVVSLSCASGNAALGIGLELIRNDDADIVLAGGYDAVTEYAWAGLLALRTMTDKGIRPFDANRDGTVFSEGAAVLVLESERSMNARGAKPLAELAGFATNNNAFHLTAPDKEGSSIARAMREALADAQVKPEQVDHVNAHATATKYNDATETAAIKEVLGSRAREIPVSGIKSMIGHLCGAASALEAVAAVKTILTGVVPPTINYQTPDPACDLDYVTAGAKPFPVNVAINNSSGLGGANSMVVLRKVARP